MDLLWVHLVFSSLRKVYYMNTPTRYSNVCQEALDVKEQFKLTDIQTLLYNHICRGDFYLRNGDGQSFYDRTHGGFGYGSDRTWVKSKFSKLVNKGLVTFKFLRDCRGGPKYTSWVWYSPKFNYNDLVDACCHVTTWKLAMIKHYFDLPDGFSKSGVYGDLELIRVEDRYTFKYKGEESIYAWDNDCKGIKRDLSWLNPLSGKKHSPTWDKALRYESFSEMTHDIISFMVHDGFKLMGSIPGYTKIRECAHYEN